MKIQTKGELMYELMKVKTAIQKKDSVLVTHYYDTYLSQLSAPTSELFHAGCFSLYTERISYHLLSMYVLLDWIDFYWDGKKFIHQQEDYKPNLLDILCTEPKAVAIDKIELTNTLYNLQKVTKHRLHIFLLPVTHTSRFTLEITYPGNVLLLFPHAESDTCLLEALSMFYYKKHLKENLPHWAESVTHFQSEFIKWAHSEPSAFRGRKMNDS